MPNEINKHDFNHYANLEQSSLACLILHKILFVTPINQRFKTINLIMFLLCVCLGGGKGGGGGGGGSYRKHWNDQTTA